MKTLVADDNEVFLTLLETTLTGAGHEVFVARDGVEALEMVREHGIRLVVSDWEMPRMNGPELCRAIRAADMPGYVYIVLVTSHDTPRESVEGLSAGADDFVGKPFDPFELIARVRTGERILSLETRDVAIFALAKLAESRDPDTGAHLERVRGYSRVLAQILAGTFDSLDEDFVRLIYVTSPLHDIGKVGIPDHVLLKPGRLSEDEFEVMKTHSALGAQTLDAALHAFPGMKFLETARDVAGSHHERWDGTGYPAGLSGRAIPLCGRIVALADVYDALTSQRVYKPPFSHETAKRMILENAGTQFDPNVVEAFVEAEEQFGEIRSRFADPGPSALGEGDAGGGRVATGRRVRREGR